MVTVASSTRRYACFRLYLPGYVSDVPSVIELSSDGFYLSSHSLSAEEPSTQWLGGYFIVLPSTEDFRFWDGQNWKSRLQSMSFHPLHQSYTVWHLASTASPSDAVKLG